MARELYSFGYNFVFTVAVAQLVESRIVIPVVVGSSPISHPTHSRVCKILQTLFLFKKWFNALFVT